MTAGRAAFGPEWLAARLGTLLPEFPQARLCVAYSGGADSAALLAALAALRGRGGRSRRARFELRAVHVDHRLQPASRDWARRCGEFAAALGVPLRVATVRVDTGGGASLEAAAREARYAALARVLEPGEHLLTAHHLEDQAETLLLALLRGGGVDGLAAMPASMPFAAGMLLRPLLEVERGALRSWLERAGHAAIDDPSNADPRFDRNFLRLEILPRLESRWPAAARTLARTSRHAGEARELLQAVARADVEAAADGAALSVVVLRRLPAPRRRNALRYWLRLRGHAAPDTRRLAEIEGPLLAARADAHPCVELADGLVRRHAGRLDVTRDRPVRRGSPRSRPAATMREWRWLEQRELELDAGGALALLPDGAGPIDLASLPDCVVVGPPGARDRLRPDARGPSRALRTLLQQARLAPWERAALPCMRAGSKLLAVGDRWHDASIAASPASRERARLVWRRAS